MIKYFQISAMFMMLNNIAFAQDTFSIVALDSTTRQVGSAGASCLDLAFAGYTNPAFLADILPDTGAVNTQSYYIQANQDNARLRMRAGDTPAQIITWLVANCANNNPEFKQYGIVGFNGNTPSSASHTGSSCISYKNHITGSIDGFHYAIQGNILKGQEILDSMEAGFRNTKGNLACRLMAAMQGANIVGADTRCNSKNTSSLFGFLQVALPSDVYGAPSLSLTFASTDALPIEPIDTLQKMLNATNWCAPASIRNVKKEHITRYDCMGKALQIPIAFLQDMPSVIVVINGNGKIILENTISKFHGELYTDELSAGYYYYYIIHNDVVKLSGKYLKN